MSRHKLSQYELSYVRNQINHAVDIAETLHQVEGDLIRQLIVVDQRRLHVAAGFNSLTGFVTGCLKFSRTQAQRIVTLVRRRTDPS